MGVGDKLYSDSLRVWRWGISYIVTACVCGGGVIIILYMGEVCRYLEAKLLYSMLC